MGGSIPSSFDYRVWAERRELSQRGPGQIPSRKWFYYNLISADRLHWQQVTANSSPFRPEKWGYCTPQSKKWGYWYPSYPHKLRLCVIPLGQITTRKPSGLVIVYFIKWYQHPMSNRQCQSKSLKVLVKASYQDTPGSPQMLYKECQKCQHLAVNS